MAGTGMHLVVKGCYVDLENTKREVLLGNSIEQAYLVEVILVLSFKTE